MSQYYCYIWLYVYFPLENGCLEKKKKKERKENGCLGKPRNLSCSRISAIFSVQDFSAFPLPLPHGSESLPCQLLIPKQHLGQARAASKVPGMGSV